MRLFCDVPTIGGCLSESEVICLDPQQAATALEQEEQLAKLLADPLLWLYLRNEQNVASQVVSVRR